MSKSNKASQLAGAAVAILSMLLLLLWMAGFLSGGKIEPGTVATTQPSAAAGTSVAVRVEERPLLRQAVGTVSSRNAIVVASKIMATVLEVNTAVGAVVHKGNVLVRLDGRELEARLREAEAGAAAAKAALQSARIEQQRFEALFTRSAVTQKEVEDTRTAFLMAQSRSQAAEQAVAQARVALGYVDIVAPIDGVVAEKKIEPGDLTAPGKPLLMIHDPQQLRVEAAVAEELAPHLAVGTAVVVHVDGLGKSFDTRIDETIPQADPATRTMAVRATLPATVGLQPGMFARLTFNVGSARTLSIPSAAVRRVGQLATVQILTPEGPRTRHVQTGTQRGDQLEILAGLESGERVLLPAESGHE